MHRRVKVLAAGITFAILLSPKVATSQTFQQSTADNQQTETGKVTASQELDVVTADQTTGVTAATANGYSAQVVSGSLDVESAQTATNTVSATTTVNVSGASGATSLTTSANGNTGIADSLGYADLTGNITQTSSGGPITASSQYNGDQAQAGAFNASVQAIANSQDVGVIGGSATMTVNQSNSSHVEADGGVVLNYTGDQGTFSAIGMANNLTTTATNGATTAMSVNQSSTGDVVQGAQFVSVGNGQTIVGTAIGEANTVSITNENNPLAVDVSQTNTSYVRGQSEVSAYEYGSGQATASGVGNSVVVGNTGSSLTLNNDQLNTSGGVEVLSTFNGTGGIGYDASSTAVAMGNSVTGYACSTCNSRIAVNNRQSNSADVAATNTVSLNSASRSVTGVSTAVGNSGTFYVSEPND